MRHRQSIFDFPEGEWPIEVPAPELAWQKMEEKLNKRADRKTAPWIWLTSFLLLLLLGAGYWVVIHGYEEQHDVRRNAGATKKPPETTIGKPTMPDNTSTFLKVPQPTQHGTSKSLVLVDKLVTKKVKQFNTYAGRSNGDEQMTNQNIDLIFQAIGNRMTHTDPDSLQQRKLIGNPAAPPNPVKGKVPARLLAGMQWNMPAPFRNPRQYFAGANGTSQPYSLLLPALYVGFETDRLSLTTELDFFRTSVTSVKPYSIKNIPSGQNQILESRFLNKVFGTGVSVGVDYRVIDRWWVGGRLEGNFWRRASATVKGEQQGPPGSQPVTVYENHYQFSDSTWAQFHKFQSGVGLEMLYKKLRWQAGLNFSYYNIALSDVKGLGNNAAANIFFRLSIKN